MVFYLWLQFYREVMITVGSRRASCSAAEKPERGDCISLCSPVR